MKSKTIVRNRQLLQEMFIFMLTIVGFSFRDSRLGVSQELHISHRVKTLVTYILLKKID